jgi:hypothetical protein
MKVKKIRKEYTRRVIKRSGELVPANITKMFLPDCLAEVRAIARRGCSDHEIAQTFGVPTALMDKWTKAYPSFREAIDEGRTNADALVVESMFKRATGMTVTDTDTHTTKLGTKKVTRTKSNTRQLPPDVDAGKFWLTNRQREHWKHRQSVEADVSVVVTERKALLDDIFNTLTNVTPPATPNA